MHVHTAILLCVGHVIQMQPDTISITAVLVEYETLTKRQMHGVATGWLRHRRPTDSERPTVPIFVRKSTFRLPFKPSVPVILIGPGTGLAPMRGFLQDRYSAFKDGKVKRAFLLSICVVFAFIVSKLWLCFPSFPRCRVMFWLKTDNFYACMKFTPLVETTLKFHSCC